MAAPPAGRFCVAFNDPTLKHDCVWTALDQAHPNLVTSYTVDRGRQYELDRTDVGRATVQISDVDGILDPTNSAGPYYGKLEPLLQACLCRQHPVTGVWEFRYRGFIEDYSYDFDPSQQVNRLTVTLVDIFEILSAVEMFPPTFGDPPPDPTYDGQVYFGPERVDTRILHVLGDPTLGTAAQIPHQYYDVFTGNVDVQQASYSPGENVLTVIQEAADGEFPGVSNVFTDRTGRLCFHGRVAKFDPSAVAPGHPSWDFHEWLVGDSVFVAANPSQNVHLRSFAFERGLAKVINYANVSPVGIADDKVAGQIVQDLPSIAKYGYRTYSVQNLLTALGPDGSGGLTVDNLTETKQMGEYFVANYKTPQNRVTDIGFRSMRLDWVGGPRCWDLLCRVDIADLVTVTVASPGGGGYQHVPHYVEGVHEQSNPLSPDMDDVTVSLDLSPASYYGDLSMFPDA